VNAVEQAALVATRWAAVLPAAELTGVRRLTGGASRQTWAAHDARSGRDLILRVAPAGSGGVPLDREAAAIEASRACGVPVPAVCAVGHDDELGAEYLVTEAVAGETIPRRILRSLAYDGAAAELGRIAARVHAATPSPGLEVVTEPVDHLVATLGRPGPPPAGLALGLRRLRDTAAPSARQALVHGDLRMGNLIVAPGRVAALLDWELVHVGDPVEDLGWLCARVWRFGSDRPAAGLGSRAELLDGYEAEAGWRPSDEELHWWELYAAVRWGLMCGVMAGRHLSGAERSVELAVIGRRAAAQERDVLELLGVPLPAAAPDAAPTGPGVHGRPTAEELLVAVAEFLRAEVQPLEGAAGYRARVAANTVDLVRRELRRSAAPPADEERLSRGVLDGSLRGDEVEAAVAALVAERLAVSLS
jgi:aminoglycoside phosphotransferase (APT) family kinase protein